MEFLKIREHSELTCQAELWFHDKWDVPVEAYAESIDVCLKNQTGVPQWYVVVENDQIIGGAGVIENDFHDRKDLEPNVCALYVEVEYRCRGVAGGLLKRICADMDDMGIDPLYLITDHTSFYERYGWEFLCMVQEENSSHKVRMYIHRSKGAGRYTGK